MRGTALQWLVTIGFPAQVVELVVEANAGGVDLSSVVTTGVLFLIGLTLWLPDKDGNKVPDVLDRAGATSWYKKWLLPLLVALAAALGVSQVGCSSLPESQRGTEWHGGSASGSVAGEIHLVDGEWHGTGSARLDASAAWRLAIVEQSGDVQVLFGRDGIRVSQRLTSDVAKFVQIEQTLVCWASWEAFEQVECEICGSSGGLAFCRPFGAESVAPTAKDETEVRRKLSRLSAALPGMHNQ